MRAALMAEPFFCRGSCRRRFSFPCKGASPHRSRPQIKNPLQAQRQKQQAGKKTARCRQRRIQRFRRKQSLPAPSVISSPVFMPKRQRSTRAYDSARGPFFQPIPHFSPACGPRRTEEAFPLRQRNRGGARGPRRPEPAENSAVKRGPAI